MEMIQPVTKTAEETLLDYKKASLKVTTFVTICFVLRFIASLTIRFVFAPLADKLSDSAAFIGQFAISAIFLQITPSIIGYFFFRVKQGGGLKRLYSVPKRMKKAVANFPATYGLAQTVNILTMLVTFLITRETDLAKSMNTLNSLQPPDIASAIFLMFDLVVIAPVFEEFIFRGLVMNELKPFGNGFSIFVSGILFGLFHGNFEQVFYTTAIGIVFGYIANVTDSTLPTTVMHALLNGIGGIILMFLSTDSVQRFIMNGDTADIPDKDMLVVAAYAIFMVCVFALIIIGLIAAVSKIVKIKRYKVKKVCPEISNGKKTALLFCSVPAVIAVLLIIDVFAGFSASLLMSGLE